MAADWTDLSATPEDALIVAAQARDEAAFAELVRRRQGWLRAFLRHLCGDAAEADDLAQETCVRVWRRMGELHQPQAFAGWVRQVALRLFLDSRRRAHLDIDASAPIDDLAGNGPAPDRAAGARIDLDRALSVLSPAERLCVTLNLGEGLSHAETAHATGWPLGTVKSHILRGTLKIRRIFGDADE